MLHNILRFEVLSRLECFSLDTYEQAALGPADKLVGVSFLWHIRAGCSLLLVANQLECFSLDTYEQAALGPADKPVATGSFCLFRFARMGL